MLTNAFKLIKHNLLKYTLLITLLFIFIFAGFLIRISYKPLDISYIKKYLNIKSLESLFPIKNFENAKVQINFLKNIVTISIYELENYEFLENKYGFNISIPKAKEINIGLKATKLFKKKLEFSYVKFNNAKLNLELKQNISDLMINKNIEQIEYFYLPSKLDFLNSELIIYFPEKNGHLIARKADIKVINKEGKLQIRDIKANNIEYLEKNKQISVEVKKPAFSFKNMIFEGSALETRVLYLGEKSEIKKKLKNFNIVSNDFIFTDLNIKYDIRDEFNLNSEILYNGVQIPTKVKGSITKDLLINAKIDMEFNKLQLLKETSKLELFSAITINNIDKILLEGVATIEIFNSRFLASSFEITSNNKNNILLASNEFNYNFNNFFIKANTIEDQLEIDKFIISNSNDQIEIKGKIENFFKNVNAQLDINFKKLSLSMFSNFINNRIEEVNSRTFQISQFESGSLENTQFTFFYNNNEIEIKKLNGKLVDTKITLENDIKVKLDETVIISKNNSKIILDLKNIYLNKEDHYILLSNNLIELNNIFDYKTRSFHLKSKINVEFTKLLSFLYALEEYSPKPFKKDSFSGNIDANIMINYSSTAQNKLSYGLSGKIIDFNLINKDDFPIKLENFNGNLDLVDNLLEINGKGLLNNSDSNIQVKLNKNYKTIVNINSAALFSSFDFLKEYNFLKSGISKLNIKIEKENLFDEEWKATLEANLYNNKVEISQVVYEKKEKKQGWLKAVYNFKDLTLYNVENLTFFTDDILIRGDIFLDNMGDVNKIKVKEFKRELDNFRANINLENNNYFALDVKGESININNFFSESNNKKQSGKVDISVNNLFFNKLNFGNTNISSEIYNNKIIRLNGDTYYNEKKSSFFSYMLNKKTNSELKLTFVDFGLFLKNLGISDKFIKGNGDVVFSLNNQSNVIIAGKYLIKDFSIKDASFLVRLLQLASFTGLLEILASEGIPFTNLQGNFKIDDNFIRIEDTRFEGLSLGASTSGSINLKNNELELEGVLIPAYAINAIINKIPLLGQIITGIEGEGIIGFNYKVTGYYEKPDYSINPFSILTPGIIRSIFKVFGNNNEEENREVSPAN